MFQVNLPKEKITKKIRDIVKYKEDWPEEIKVFLIQSAYWMECPWNKDSWMAFTPEFSLDSRWPIDIIDIDYSDSGKTCLKFISEKDHHGKEIITEPIIGNAYDGSEPIHFKGKIYTSGR